ncbi:ribonuclease HI [Sulfurihydrogenibium subterraneum]|uniref:ribonuclease HI n=1 Tax=Sulfurihydrogenibium subterraneum TaxID=171121 RepID=UPI00048A7B77|nr:ribonuclease HI [Sulfurihydrogenibium subterraneum]
MKKLKIFADGSCLKNPGPGGYCSIITDGEKKAIIKGSEKNSTNNRMELTAVIKALESLKKSPYEIELYTDSNYVVNGINSWLEKWIKNNWKTSSGKPVENQDLWKKLYELLQKHKVKAFWIKGHSGHPENEYCDKIAKQEALKVKDEKK